ncbi:MAG: lipoprotein [Casimicrobium sp.]
MRTRTAAALVLAIVLLAVGLSGCGQKGPLVPPKASLLSTNTTTS